MPGAAHWIALLAMSGSVIAAATVACAEDTLRLAVSRRGSWETAVAEIGTRAGIFRKRGLRLDIAYTALPGSNPAKMVISGEADIGVGARTDSAMWLFAKGEPVRVIGSARVRSNDPYWYVKADNPMRSIKEATEKTTIAYDREASFTHTLVLGFIKVYGLKSRPTKTGHERATLRAVMKGRVDVGGAAPPFGLWELSEGKVRIVSRGRDLLSTPNQTVSTMVANAARLAEDRPVIERFVKAYAEALDYMYASPAALKHYKDVSGNDEAFARTAMIEFYPRDSLDPYRIEGLDGVMANAIGYLLRRPLSKEELAELFQVPGK